MKTFIQRCGKDSDEGYGDGERKEWGGGLALKLSGGNGDTSVSICHYLPLTLAC